MPKVFIAGNSGAARECYWILKDLLEASPGLRGYYDFSGFLSWNGYQGDLKELAHFFAGDLSEHGVDANALYVIGVGKPQLRRDIYEFLKARQATLMNLIHPWTYICPSARIGEGNVFQRGCTVFTDAVVGNGNYLNGAVNLSHDASLGDFNFLAPYAIVLGGARIGNCNHLAPHAVITEHASVGDENLIGPNSSVFKGCGSNKRLMGTPALVVGDAQA